MVSRFNAQRKKGLGNNATLDYSIKWSSTLKTKLEDLELQVNKFVLSTWRPFVKQWYYSDKALSDRLTRNHFEYYGPDLDDKCSALYLPCPPMTKDMQVLAIAGIADYHVTGDAVVVPFRLPHAEGQLIDNITDWALKQFTANYKTTGKSKKIRRNPSFITAMPFCTTPFTVKNML